MAMRVVQPEGARGSLKWIQRAVNERWQSLEDPIKSVLGPYDIEWLSPLCSDSYAEYRDGSFLDRIGHVELSGDLKSFWPARGPQWDALGRTAKGDVLLVEAKAHVREPLSPGTAAGDTSRARIEEALYKVATGLGARADRAAWTHHFYQLANRIAHLDFLRSQGVPAWLVLVNFVGDEEMGGPSSREVWDATYLVAFHVMGLPRLHRLAPFLVHAYPDVRGGEIGYAESGHS